MSEWWDDPTVRELKGRMVFAVKVKSGRYVRWMFGFLER